MEIKNDFVENKLIGVGFPDPFLPEFAGALVGAKQFRLLRFISDVGLHAIDSFIHPIEEKPG